MFAWLNLVLQPCAMAMGGGSAMCPVCPSMDMRDGTSPAAWMQHHHAMDGAAGEAAMPAAAPQELHPGSAACGGDLLDCADLDELNQGDRSVQRVTDSGQGWIVSLPLDYLGPEAPKRVVTHLLFDIGRSIGASPPLNVLHCVYRK